MAAASISAVSSDTEVEYTPHCSQDVECSQPIVNVAPTGSTHPLILNFLKGHTNGVVLMESGVPGIPDFDVEWENDAGVPTMKINDLIAGGMSTEKGPGPERTTREQAKMFQITNPEWGIKEFRFRNDKRGKKNNRFFQKLVPENQSGRILPD
jgi:hypothetical protein